MQSTENPKRATAHIRPRPTKLSGIVLIVAGIAFLAFSALPFSVTDEDARPFVMMFGVVWVLVCIAFIIYGVYILSSSRPTAGIVYDIEDSTTTVSTPARDDFEARLLKLEKLKQDRLISEEEYRQKREEIMKSPW
jgi:hypothetical protein